MKGKRAARPTFRGQGVKGRAVRLGGYPRELRVTAVRCFKGKRSYRLRDDERGVPIVYHYLKAVKLKPLPRGACVPVDVIERVLNPPVAAFKTPWVPASAVKFVRHNYEEKA